MAQMFEIMYKKKGRKISLIDPTSTYEKHALAGKSNIVKILIQRNIF
jgi:hypothetical protein